jgi:MoaA/NifB/PqqE/SkfB family radical SAM enzyme
MSLAHQMRDFTAQQATKMIVELLDRVTDKRLIQLTYLAEKLNTDPDVLAAIGAIRRMLESPEHSTKQLFHRVLGYLPKQIREKIFYTLFNNAWFMGGKKRDLCEETLGFRPPFIMILSPTWQCNLRCAGCYTLGYQRHPGLEYDLVKRILQEAEDLGIYFVTILGGEPFMYPDLFRMIEDHPNIFFQVYTNGTLMNEERAQRIAELGNVAIVISCEGYEEETDRWRGKGVYRKIMEAMDYVRQNRVILGSSATVTRHNVETVASDEFIDMMIDKGIVAQMYFLYIPVNGQGDLNLMVSPEQRNYLRKQVNRFRREKPLFVLDFWNDGPHVEGCIAGGRRYFHINAKGDVEPCVYTHIAEHNIRDVSLAEALDSKLFRCIRRRQPHNPNHLRPCMIIDNPHVYREVIKESGAYFTHPGAEQVVTDMADDLDAYARRFAELADRVWEEEYVKKSERAQAPSESAVAGCTSQGLREVL